jgi:hypothetical protein
MHTCAQNIYFEKYTFASYQVNRAMYVGTYMGFRY